MIIIEFIKNDVGDYIEVQEEDLYETIDMLTTQFITGEVSYFRVFHS